MAEACGAAAAMTPGSPYPPTASAAALTDIVRCDQQCGGHPRNCQRQDNANAPAAAGVEYPPTPTPTPPGNVSDFPASEDKLPPMMSHVVTMSGEITLILETDSMTSIGWIRNECATFFSVPAIRCKLLRGTLILGDVRKVWDTLEWEPGGDNVITLVIEADDEE